MADERIRQFVVLNAKDFRKDYAERSFSDIENLLRSRLTRFGIQVYW